MEPYEKNYVCLKGRIVSPFYLSHETDAGRYYTFYMEMPRLSSRIDTIPVMIRDNMADITRNEEGSFVVVTGSYRSYNRATNEYPKKLMYVNADRVVFEGSDEFNSIDRLSDKNNFIHLEGTICRDTLYRKTVRDKEITEILLAVPRKTGIKSDYINCIAWMDDARTAAMLEAGDRVCFEGRIQSRDYVKQTGGEGESENRVAYEVSVSMLSVGWSEPDTDAEQLQKEREDSETKNTQNFKEELL